MSEAQQPPQDSLVQHQPPIDSAETVEAQSGQTNESVSTAELPGHQRAQSRSRSKKKRRMFCANCNRMERHRRGGRKSWLNSYFTGLTFGLNRFLGPFKCTCCGHNRWVLQFKRGHRR